MKQIADCACVAVIPARGGSKGIPRKNILPVAGKPLIAWSIEAARGAKLVDGVYVSTDDVEIAAAARQYGAEVIDRPAELATDVASSEDALLHAMDAIKRTRRVDLLVFLQATSPVRESVDIDNAIRQLQSTGADSLFSCLAVEDHFMWEKAGDSYRSVNYDYRRRKLRQNIEPRYLENGSIYVLAPELLRKENNRLGGKIGIYEMPFWKSFQVDNLDDLAVCEYYLRTRLLGEKAFT